LAAAGLTRHLDLEVGSYGDQHEIRAELVAPARAAAAAAYGQDFGGTATVLVGDTPLDVAAALATGARAVGVATGHFSTARPAGPPGGRGGGPGCRPAPPAPAGGWPAPPGWRVRPAAGARGGRTKARGRSAPAGVAGVSVAPTR